MRDNNGGYRIARAIALVAGAGMMALTLSIPVLAADDDIVATVNGKAIVEADVKMLENLMGEALSRIPEASRHAALVNVLIETQLLAGAAEKAGKAGTPEFARRLDWLKAQALRDTFVREDIDAQISDEMVKARYEEMIAQAKPESEIRARHILVASEDEAKAIIADLDKGGDFAELAKARSTGPTGPNGGDLGFFGPGRMVPEFDKAAFALNIGEYSKVPVKTQFGWHVIKVEEERVTPPPSFDEVKSRLRQRMESEKLRETVEGLKTKAQIDIKQP